MTYPRCQVLRPNGINGELLECANVAHIIRYNKSNGMPVYRRFRTTKDERKYICSSCHMRKYPRIKYNENITRGKGYKNYRKEYCENVDARLGFNCTYIIQDPDCQLGVDHIDGDKTNNDPENLQTLCANCHNYKTKMFRDSGVKKSHVPTLTAQLEL